MPKLNLLNPTFNSYLLLVLSLTTVVFEVNFYNQILFCFILFFSIFQNLSQYKLKTFYSSIIAIISIYIQFKLSDETFSKEFFLNIVLLLIFIKFSEAKKRSDYYFFNYSIIFLSVSSLIYGQDFISSINSLLLMLLSIIHLYSINQQEVIQLNFKYIGKYSLIGIIALIIILIIYLLFPRYELNIKLFESAQNNLGIPDKIELGSFSEISNNEEIVFIYDTLENKIKDPLYFRVKIFDLLDDQRSWISTPKEAFDVNYNNDYKINKSDKLTNNQSKLIVYPTNKTWLPTLKDFHYKNNLITNNYLNGTAKTSKKIIKKTPYVIQTNNLKINFEDNLLNFYKKLPKSFSKELYNWSLNQRKNSLSNFDYLNNLMLHFAKGDYFYSLSPNIDNTNNYEKFFFETKTGYCEYYAGIFAILARLQGVPTRLVSGYMGGSYNELGNFYTFKQSDAHTWVESYIENKGWIRFDPTQVIPQINIISFNNVSSNNLQSTSLKKDDLFFKPNMIKLYYNYFDYIWTNKFLDYDQKSRDKFIKNNFQNLKFNLFYIFIFVILLILIKPIKIITNKKLLFSFLFSKIRFKNNILHKSLTHQELFKKLSNDDQIKFIDVFNLYEKLNYAKNYRIDYKTFFIANYKIMKFYLNT
jgi:hypothetical protein